MSSVYVRKFDWDEARARRAAGESYTEIARALGVSHAAVHRVCDEAYRRQSNARSAEWIKGGACIDCGAPCTRNTTMLREGLAKGRCMACAAIAKVTSVRPEELRCSTCREWKPDRAFPRSRREDHRRGRHKQCQACNTAAKRAWRHANGERVRVYDRERKRRQRQREAVAA